jgi:hypothetical protein
MRVPASRWIRYHGLIREKNKSRITESSANLAGGPKLCVCFRQLLQLDNGGNDDASLFSVSILS